MFMFTAEKSAKRKKVERSNRKRVICLYCDKELNSDNKNYHHNSKHANKPMKFRDVVERSQRQISFVLSGATTSDKVSLD